MKKLLFIALLVVAMVFTMVACTEEGPTTETGDTAAATGDTTASTDADSSAETKADTTTETKADTTTETQATTTPATTPATTPVSEPAATEPAATEPAATEPAATEPAATEPAAPETETPVEIKVDAPYYMHSTMSLGDIYFNGTISNGRINGDLDAEGEKLEPKMVKLEAGAAEGEYYIYFYKEGVKTYLSAAENKAAGLAFVETADDSCVWLIDVNAQTIISKKFDNRGLGTQTTSAYKNLSLYAVSNFAKVDEYDAAWFAIGEEEDITPPETEPALLAPMWDEKKDVVMHQSFDELRKNGDGAQGVFTGPSAGWDLVADLSDGATSFLHYWGWVAIGTEEVGQFGYAIDSGKAIFDDSFAVTPEAPVVGAAAGVAGSKGASRMLIKIDVAGLWGAHYVDVLYKAPDGVTVTLCRFDLIMPELVMWDTEKDVITHQSYDELKPNGDGASIKNQTGVYDVTADMSTLKYWGWIGVKGEIGQFGYQIDSKIPVFDDSFTHTTEQPVINAAMGVAGTENASRMAIMIDLTKISGEGHTVNVLYKNPDGVIRCLGVLTINAPEREIEEGPVVKPIPFGTSVDLVNGSGPNDTANYAGRGGNWTKGVDVIDGAADGKTIGEDYLLTIDGWMGLKGGVNRYVWSVDGETWHDVTSGGRDGEPVPGHFAAGCGAPGEESLKNGMFKGEDQLVADLSAYAGQTVAVTFAAVSEAEADRVVPFVQITGLVVPEAPAISADDEVYPLLNGTYYVLNDEMTAANYELTIAVAEEGKGTLTIVDNSGVTDVAGTYDWTYTTAGGMVITNDKGIMIGSRWGSLIFQCTGLMFPQDMVTELPEGPVALVLGDNAIVIEDAYNGIKVVFTAEEAGTYVFAWGETAGIANQETDSGIGEIELGEVELAAGEDYLLILFPAGWDPDTVNLVISKKAEAPAPQLL